MNKDDQDYPRRAPSITARGIEQNGIKMTK
jgi:hypothetical protein